MADGDRERRQAEALAQFDSWRERVANGRRDDVPASPRHQAAEPTRHGTTRRANPLRRPAGRFAPYPEGAGPAMYEAMGRKYLSAYVHMELLATCDLHADPGRVTVRRVDMAARFGVSVSAMEKAYRRLMEGRLLERVSHGRWYVMEAR